MPRDSSFASFFDCVPFQVSKGLGQQASVNHGLKRKQTKSYFIFSSSNGIDMHE